MLKYIITAIILIVPLAGAAEHIEMPKKIAIVADEWCPYNCKKSEKNKGFIVDMAKAIFAKHGIEVEYKVVPWARAIEMTKSGHYDALIGANKTEGAGLIFPDKEQAITKYTFFTLIENSWKYEGENSLKNITLGALEDYYYGAAQNYIDANKSNNKLVQSISSDSGAEINLKKLLAHRITAVIEDLFVMENVLAQTGNSEKVRIAGLLSETSDKDVDYIYVAFSPAKPYSKKLAKIMSDGTKEMESNGKLKAIMEKYGIK